MNQPVHACVRSKWAALVSKLRNERFRHAYFEKSSKAYLANQIRAIRGDHSQTEFGKRIGATQSVVSRLEDEDYGKLNTQTLIDIAKKLDIALVIKFVDFLTFLEETEEFSERTLAPKACSPEQWDRLEGKGSPVTESKPPTMRIGTGDSVKPYGDLHPDPVTSFAEAQ